MYNNNIKRQETVGNSESKQVEYSPGVFKTRNELKIQAISSIFLLHRNINDHFPFNLN